MLLVSLLHDLEKSPTLYLLEGVFFEDRQIRITWTAMCKTGIENCLKSLLISNREINSSPTTRDIDYVRYVNFF